MGVNRVDFGDETIIDISSSTVTAETLAKGSTAYGADGEQIQGQAEFGGDTSDCYKITDSASTEINDTDYVPLSDADGNKKKSLWSNIKTVLGNVFALKNHTVITGSLSLGRKADSTRGMSSLAIGNNVTASGYGSHAEGNNTTASYDYSHAEGGNTEASYLYTHAEGQGTIASNSASHAEGYYTTASGYISHAEGQGTIASGTRSHAEGSYTEASGSYQHVQGKYNIKDDKSDYAHIVGNGNSSSERSNAHTLDWNGNAWFSGDVESETAGKLSDKVPNEIVASVWREGSYASGSIVIEDNKLWKNYTNLALSSKPSDFDSGWALTSVGELLQTTIGTWTPTAREPINSFTYATYSRTGNVITCSARCVFGNITATNKMYFTNLPFPPAINSQIIGAYRCNSSDVGGALLGNIGSSDNRVWANDQCKAFANDTVYICFTYICK